MYLCLNIVADSIFLKISKQILWTISIMSFFDFDDNISSKKDPSFFDDKEDTRAGEKRPGFDLEADGDANSSEDQMKAPTYKRSKVDSSPSAVKQASTQEAHLIDRDINENSESIKIKNKDGKNLPSDTLGDAIEEMRNKVLAMIPGIKMQEEAGDSVVARGTVLVSDIRDYREQLAEVKHEYTSTLNLIFGILGRSQ